MTTRKKEYERLSSRAERGEYELVAPLDYRILDSLVDEGTMLADLYEIGTTSRELSKKFPLSSHVLGPRLASMRIQGLTRKVKLIGGGGSGGKKIAWAWQRTHKGKQVVETWKKEGGK